ncbi:MAG: hypothetical protein ACOYMA_08575 [Bacteroidia bacterium]
MQKTINVLKPQNRPKENKLEELYSIINNYHLSDTIYLLGQINSRFKFGHNELVKDQVSEIDSWILNYYSGRFLQLHFDSNRLIRYLLLSKSNDFKSKKVNLNEVDILHLFDVVGNLYEKEIEQDVYQSFARIAQKQFPLQVDKSETIGRTYLLFMDIAQSYSDPYDINTNFINYFGLTPIQFILSGYALWLKSEGNVYKEMEIDLGDISDRINTKTVNQFINLSLGDHISYKKHIRGSNWTKMRKLQDYHGFEALVKMPFFKIEKSSNIIDWEITYLVPEPHYILERMATGIFYLLADKEKEIAESENKPNHNAFRNFFGDKVYKDFVKRHLSQKVEGLEFIDFDEDIEHSGKKPDFAIISEKICVLFEVKTGLLTLNSRTFFEPSEIHEEVKSKNIGKAVKQLSDFEKAILQKEIKKDCFKHIETVIKVIIGYEDIYSINSVILEHVDTINYKNFQFGTISDVEAIGLVLQNKLDITKILLDKISTEKYSWQIRTVILEYIDKEKTRNNILFDSCDLFMKMLIE